MKSMTMRITLPTIAPILALLVGCDIGEIDLGDTDGSADASTTGSESGSSTKDGTAQSTTGVDPSESGESSPMTTTSSSGSGEGSTSLSSSSESGTTAIATEGSSVSTSTGEDTSDTGEVQGDPVLRLGCLAARGVPFPDSVESCPGAGFDQAFFDRENGYCLACMCLVECTEDSDCTPPSSGSAQPTCQGGHCEYACSDDSECPSDSRCVPGPNDEPSRCMVVAEGDLECATPSPNIDPCAEFTTAEACNAEISDQSLLRCSWVEEQYFGDDQDTSNCEAADVVGRCLMTVELEGYELERSCEASCDGTSASYWEAIRGGTYGIVDLPCELAPFGLSDLRFDGEQCGLGGEDPLICGCGGFSTCE